jgi:lysine N6-hydroxylase
VLQVRTAERLEQHRVGYAVIAVGRQSAPVPLSAELRERLEVDDHGEMVVEEDYSVRWKGMDDHRIYALNRARFSHGIPDANVTLLPVRAAMVINSMTERRLFQIRDELCPVQWG